MYMIYQLESEPVKESERICEATFFDTSFMKSVAEYVTQEINIDAETKNLISVIEQCGGKTCHKEMCFWFPEGFSGIYFRNRFNLCVIHNNGITLSMTGTDIVAVDMGYKKLS